MIAFLKTILYVPIFNILVFLVWLIPNHSVGWAIIVLTIIVRLVLLPSSIKSSKASLKLQMLQPEINRIRKEIKDQQAQGKAIMDLYKKEGASPFGSCLPLLIQLPIIFVLYQVFLNINKNGLAGETIYSFIPHVDTINTLFFGLDLAVPEKWALPIVAGVTQFILSKMMIPPTPPTTAGSANDPTAMLNKQMVYLFPIITIIFARSLPAALSLYWIVTTLFGIGQQIYVNKAVRNQKQFKAEVAEDEKEIEEEIVELKSEEKPAPKKKDFMTNLMNKRLDKQERKTGVEVTIRKKQ